MRTRVIYVKIEEVAGINPPVPSRSSGGTLSVVAPSGTSGGPCNAGRGMSRTSCCIAVVRIHFCI